MRKLLAIFFSLFTFARIFTPIGAAADQKLHISFVMVNPQTNANAGPGTDFVLSQVNRNDMQQAQTNSLGVVSFDIAPEVYILDTYCPVCYGKNRSQAGTEYLITPQGDGKVSVISATDQPVIQDANGNWIITTLVTRSAVANDPWKLMNTNTDLGGRIAHLYLLTNGKVLTEVSVNGNKMTWWLLSPDVNGDYSLGTWEKISEPSPDYNPDAMNGAVLHNGNLMIVGGEFNYNAQGQMEENTNKSYIFDVVHNSWTQIAPPNNGEGYWGKLGAPPFVALPDGRVMLSYFGDFGRSSYNESMIYDPISNMWTLTGTNKHGRTTEAGYTLLSNDKVLTVNTDRGVSSAEIFDPATGRWSPAGNTPQVLANSEIGPALTLPSGKVLAEGATGANALYDPATNSWSAAPNFPKLGNGLQLEAPDNYSAILPSGNVLTSTGTFICSTQNCTIMGPSPFFEYDWKANAWIKVIDDLLIPSSSAKGADYVMLSLPTGQVMIAYKDKIEFYSSSGIPDPTWLPIVDSISSENISPATTYQISGKQLSGLTQGTHFGDEHENATNYPIVQIENIKTHHVSYARSFDFSSTSIQPNVSSTFNFIVNPKIENGPSLLRVIASGFASTPTQVTVSGGAEIVTAQTPTLTPPHVAASTQAKVVTRTIICVKLKTVKKVTSNNPKCPNGYKQK